MVRIVEALKEPAKPIDVGGESGAVRETPVAGLAITQPLATYALLSLIRFRPLIVLFVLFSPVTVEQPKSVRARSGSGAEQLQLPSQQQQGAVQAPTSAPSQPTRTAAEVLETY